MNHFRRTAFVRISLVTAVVSLLSAPPVWLVSRERAEAEVVAFAQEETRRIVLASDSLDLQGSQAPQHAARAARALVGGLFEIVEIYDSNGLRLAEELTTVGTVLEKQLPKHTRPDTSRPSYESFHLADGRWAMRVLVPLVSAANGPQGGAFWLL